MKLIFMLVIGILFHNLSFAQLQVDSARWEVAGGGANCDATGQLAAECDGSQECQIPVDEDFLCTGDPAPGRKKVLDIRYSCDGMRQAPVGFPDQALATLSCRRGHSGNPPLQIHYARWQVRNGGAGCDATGNIARACNGKDGCEVYIAAPYVCKRDPAYGQMKRMEVEYSCAGEVQRRIAFDDNTTARIRCSGSYQVPRNAQHTQPSQPSYPIRTQPSYPVAQPSYPVAQPSYPIAQPSPRPVYPPHIIAQPSPRPVMPPPVMSPPPQAQPQPMPAPLQGSHGNTGGSGGLKVINARWEVIGGGPWCDATPQLARACDGRGQCQLPVDGNYLCGGDPAAGRGKRLDVKYMCNGVIQQPLGFADFSQAILQCGTGPIGGPPATNPLERQLLQVSFARWEVNGGGPWCDAMAQVAAACNGRRVCQVPVDARSLCSDPAPGRYKTLELRYTCRGRPQANLGFPDGSQAVLRCD